MESMPKDLQNVAMPPDELARAVAVAKPTNEKVRRAADARRKARKRLLDGDSDAARAALRSTAADLCAYADATGDESTRAEADELLREADAFATETVACSAKSLYHGARTRYQGRKRRPS